MVNDKIPSVGSKCPARIWPFRKHNFTTRTSYLQEEWYTTNSCSYCGGFR